VQYDNKVYTNNDVITTSAVTRGVIGMTCDECDLTGTMVKSSEPVAVVGAGGGAQLLTLNDEQNHQHSHGSTLKEWDVDMKEVKRLEMLY
jgi:hypothetical protein